LPRSLIQIVAQYPGATARIRATRSLEDDARRGDIMSYFWHNVGFRMIEVKLSGS